LWLAAGINHPQHLSKESKNWASQQNRKGAPSSALTTNPLQSASQVAVRVRTFLRVGWTRLIIILARF
jgi:hypothetical protein